MARLTIELNDILAAVGKVSELDLSDVPPTSHPLAVVNVFRPDEPRPSLPLDDVFANAPERDSDYFRVPPTARPRSPPLEHRRRVRRSQTEVWHRRGAQRVRHAAAHR